MKQISKTEFFQICLGLGALLIGAAIGIYFYKYFRGTEGWLLIMGVTVYNIGVFGFYLIKDAEGKKAIGQTYLSRLLIWASFAIILLLVNWLANL